MDTIEHSLLDKQMICKLKGKTTMGEERKAMGEGKTATPRKNSKTRRHVACSRK